MAAWMRDKPDWARLYGRMVEHKAGRSVPPPTKYHQTECHSYYPGLAAHEFWDRKDAWWCNHVEESVATLERFYPDIKAEMLALRKSALQQYRQPNVACTERELSTDGETTLLHKDGDWNVLYLQLEGADCSEQRALAPIASRIARSLKRASGHALFSVLDPGTHILPHCGPSNHRLRLHLGLVIPQPCSIRVGEETRTWEEGKVLVLDDAFEHEVRNDSSEQRIVLLVDVWHPHFSEKEILFLEQMRTAKRRSEGGREGAQMVQAPAVPSASDTTLGQALTANARPNEENELAMST